MHLFRSFAFATGLAFLLSAKLVWGEPLPLAEWDFRFQENLIWVKARMDSQPPLNFILDSACTEHVLDAGAADRLGIPLGHESMEVRRCDIVEKQGLTPPQSVQIENLELRDVRFLVVPLNGSSDGKKPVDGILGAPLFEKFLVQIDYQAYKIRLFSREDRAVLEGTEPVGLRAQDQLLGLQLKDAQGRAGMFVVDTGCAHAVIVGPHAAKNFSLTGCCSKTKLLCAGGRTEVEARTGTSWFLGGQPVQNVETLLCASPVNGLLGNPKWTGIVGNVFLSNFKVTFDWSAAQLYLQPVNQEKISLVRR